MRRCVAIEAGALWLVCLAAAPALAQRAATSGDPYAGVEPAIESFISHEMDDKGIPAMSIALVDDQKLVWARGFGYADPARHVAATADTVYRVGSISKLYTDIAVMRQVERGKLDLDAPITRYLPEFRPNNPFDTPITLRHLMTHRSGLVREPPVGSYFDASERTLAELVASLNRTTLVHEPATRPKYSNAGVAVAGHLLERTQRTPFSTIVHREVMEPLGMRSSGFEATPALIERLAKASMWTVDGRIFPAPPIMRSGIPSGSLYSTVEDTARFISALLAGGAGLLRADTLEQMLTPQYAKPDDKAGYGIGFAVSELDGHRAVGHGGAIYGFASTLRLLPEDKLGVIVVSSMDLTNGVTDRVADYALRTLLAARAGRPLPQPPITTPVPADLTRKLLGRYASSQRTLEITLDAVEDTPGKLVLCCTRDGLKLPLRMLGAQLVADGRVSYGNEVTLIENGLTLDGESFARAPATKPEPPPARWRGLIGEYGEDHNILYIFERDRQLWALIEWVEFDPLREVSDSVYAFPERGLYPYEQLLFKRDAQGRATQVEAAGIVFKRRAVGPQAGVQQLRITPQRPIAELIPEALRAAPPKEAARPAASDLVELTRLDPSIKLDIRYATTNNFLGSVLYSEPRAFLQRKAAEGLVSAHTELKKQGYGLMIHDAYRPWYVTKVFWEATPAEKRMFVADPRKGSRHNRGAAVDLTLYDLNTGQPVEMVATYDETTDRSAPDYPGGSALQRWHRDLLRNAMEAQGYTVNPVEWWHFDYRDWRQYPIGNQRFDEIPRS